MGERCIACSRDKQTEMAVEATPKVGRYGAGIGFQLCEKVLKRFVSGRAMNLGEHFVLEVSVIDTGEAGGHRRWTITRLCH